MFDKNRKQGLSVIVPYFNEEDGIKEYCKMIDSYAAKVDFFLEIVFVDDGSTDQTVHIIETFKFQNVGKIKIINLAKNFGSHAAIRAGVFYSSCDVCTWMGCDLQEPAAFLEIAYRRIREGYDAVYIEKKTIRGSKINRCFSKLYSTLMKKYAVANYGTGGISNIVFNRKLIDFLNGNIESNSSIALQIIDAGFKNCTVAMDFKERFAGNSKWTLQKKMKLFIDSFAAFSFMPIRLVSIIGMFIFTTGSVIGILTIINKIWNPDVPIGYSSLASILALGFGITNISLGILAEYLWRTYDAARKRPVFIISEIAEIKCAESSE